MIQQKVRKKNKARFNVHFWYSQAKITGLNKMWSLERLVMLKCESRTSQHVIQYNDQPESYYFKNG